MLLGDGASSFFVVTGNKYRPIREMVRKKRAAKHDTLKSG